MRIGIANSHKSLTNDLSKIILNINDYKIVWISETGNQTVKQCALNKPDLVLIDLNIENMDWFQAIETIMRQYPCHILITTSAIDENAAKIFKAMGYGPIDVVNTSEQGIRENLLKKIKTVSKLCKSGTCAVSGDSMNLFSVKQPVLIAIGSSTGGPYMLEKIFANLPDSLNAAIVVIQHINKEFSDDLVSWLKIKTRLKVRLAVQGDSPEPGFVYVPSTNDHLTLTPGFIFSYTSIPENVPYRPSVDVFFTSLAQHCFKKGMAILLTGMGRDGAMGMAKLRKAGWYTVAQNEKTSVVYGMPKAAKELNAAMEILPVEEIGPAIVFYLKKNRN